MNVTIPELSLVVLVGPSGAGKSTFAARHFVSTEVVSSDRCRGLVCDDENDITASGPAFELLKFTVAQRLELQKMSVVDATSCRSEDRSQYVELARRHHVLPVAIVFDLAPAVCNARNIQRTDRVVEERVIKKQSETLRRSSRKLKREGFRQIIVLNTPEEVDAVRIERQPLWTDKRQEHGPFDLIGDVHGCRTELVSLLRELGYRADGAGFAHPEGRKAFFVGDLVDRGPDSPGVLRIVMDMVHRGHALCVPGNHDVKLMRKLKGNDVKISHGLAETLAQLESESEAFKQDIVEFVDKLVSHFILDDGNLVVAHAGMKQKLQGRASATVRAFALYGETTGETDEYGLPMRYNWAGEYRRKAHVVYGHTPVSEPKWVNRTLCIDTGCVFGGKLTALRWPEKALVQVAAERMYYEPMKPLVSNEIKRDPDVLDIRDVLGKRVIETRLHHRTTVREENAAAGLEIMSRFAIDPRWLIYLPPTMSPTETCPDGPYLEHPRQAFDFYTQQGIEEVVCEEKHMGSRAVIVLCADEAAAMERFGASGERIGVVYTRTGRPFFADASLEVSVLRRLQQAATQVGLWSTLQTRWLCIDAEIMPWSFKAVELVERQYAPVGAAATHALTRAVQSLEIATAQGRGDASLLAHLRQRLECAQGYVEAYRRYCADPSTLRIAPFHLLASEGKVHTDRDHVWHMDTLARMCAEDPSLLTATPYRRVALRDAAQVEQAMAWWEALTQAGGEGMVVKPRAWINETRKGLVQPAVKCRGREYLRMIYGPEYTLPGHMERLRARNVGAKRSLALREFTLGMEALHRFVEKEPLYRVHECVFGVLSLETEPVDPRL